MYPFSYTTMKIIHDQKITEALEHQRLYTEHKPGMLQVLGSFLTRLTIRSNQKKEGHPCNLTPTWEVYEPISRC